MKNEFIRRLDEVSISDIRLVGGKNASIGEMIQNLSAANVRVPGGFAVTSTAFDFFLKQNNLEDVIYKKIEKLNVDDVEQLKDCGSFVRSLILNSPVPDILGDAIEQAYNQMSEKISGEFSVAVRSSATAEDLPDASFAGQQETYLNVVGLSNIKDRIKDVFSSLFNDRAISYRSHQGFDSHDVSISVGVQQMVRSDLAASGVMFTLDTESGYRDVVFITSSYGLGEQVVQGAVNPDEFYVCKKALNRGDKSTLMKSVGTKETHMIFSDAKKNDSDVEVSVLDVPFEKRGVFSISEKDVEELAQLAISIENHYGRPMDIEWAKDGNDGKLYIVQARPETVQSNQKSLSLENYVLEESGEVIAEGRSIGSKIGIGKALIIPSANDMDNLKEGDILITDMTDPDWEPVMKRASAIVTNRGGRTCHAAIIARELGVPAIVGCGDATTKIESGTDVTVDCSQGDTGRVLKGLLKYTKSNTELAEMPEIKTKLMLNVGNPERAFSFARLPNDGVGLARLEFIINQFIGIHPKALLNFDHLDGNLRTSIAQKIKAYRDPKEYFVRRLAEGVSTIAAAFDPKPVIVRLSDFKSNEYSNLLGGSMYEPREENPMIGFRGASRYISNSFRPCFDMECEAIKYVRGEMGLKNLEIMVPFVRTVNEAAEAIQLLKANGLERGVDGLKIIMMCELPSNAILAEQFLEYFDGFSIGSNDMTQLALGLDRDSELISHLFDERDEAVKLLMEKSIEACRKEKKYVGICGQAPSDHPDLAAWLLNKNISSISLNPDTVIPTWLELAKY